MKSLYFFFKDQSQKAVDDILTICNTNYLNEEKFESKSKHLHLVKIILEIRQVYSETAKEISPLQLTKYIFSRTQRLSSWVESLRALLIIHKLTHTIGSEFVPDFSSQKWPDYTKQRKESQGSYKKLAHLVFIEIYKQYLVKLTYNYADFKAVFAQSTDTYKQLSNENLSLLHLLSKFQNMLFSLLKFDHVFEVLLIQYPNENILKQAAYFILTDAYHFYTFISKNVLGIIDQIFELPVHEAIFLYEIYAENVQITKKLKRMMEFKVLLQDFESLEPIYFTLPPEEIKKIEVHIHSLKARVQIERMMKVEINLKYAPSADFNPTRDDLEIDNSQKRVKSQMDVNDTEKWPSKKLYTDNEVGAFSKNILNSVTPSFNIFSESSSFNTIFLAPKKKNTEQAISDKKAEPVESQIEEKRKQSEMFGKYKVLTTLEQFVEDEERKNEQEINEELPDSNEAIEKSSGENKEASNKKRSLQRTFTLGKFVTNSQNKSSQHYVPVNVANQTQNESYSAI